MILTIRELDTHDPAALYHKYPQQTAPQGAYLELDCETGVLTADWNAEIGNGVPESVWHGRKIRWGVPAGLLPDQANKLMEALRPLMEQVLDGYSTYRDAQMNLAGELTDVATDLSDEIDIEIESRVDSDIDCVCVEEAGTWFAETRYQHLQDLCDGMRGIDAIRAEVEAETTGPDGGPLVLTDIDDYLDGLKSDLAETTYRVRVGDQPPDSGEEYDTLDEARTACLKLAEQMSKEGEGEDVFLYDIGPAVTGRMQAGACPRDDDGDHWPIIDVVCPRG